MLAKTTVRGYYTFLKRAKLKKKIKRKHQALLRIQCRGTSLALWREGAMVQSYWKTSVSLSECGHVWLRWLTPSNLVKRKKRVYSCKKILYKNVCSNFTYVLVTQSCLTLCIDCSLRGSSVHEIFQARILEWVAIPSSKNVYSNFLQ